MDSTRQGPGDRVGLFVDGPNVFRSEFHADFDDLREAAESFGRLAMARVYLDADAPADLLRAAEAHGFEVVVTSGDVDVRLAVEATEAATDREVGTITVASRDLDFKPVLEAAKRHGARTVAIAPGEHGRSEGLCAAANEAVLLEGD
jgi:uncharacterized protein (TIGR00288 family)